MSLSGETQPLLSEPVVTPFPDDPSLRKSRFQKMSLILNLTLINLFSSTCFAMLGPFFPREATLKGLNFTVIGFIVGEFSLITFMASPFLGVYLPTLGVRFIYILGVFVTGYSTILFGVLEYCPPGTIFAVMCFLTRGVSALGNAMFVVASFAIISNEFPNNVSTMFGLLEVFNGMGFMVGPSIGGALFTYGGFKLPFIVLGAVLLLVSFVSSFTLPVIETTERIRTLSVSSRRGVRHMVTSPYVCLQMVCFCCTASFMGLADVAFQPFLTLYFDMNPLQIGLVFLLIGFIYALFSPLWGYLTDNKGLGLVVMFLGIVTYGSSIMMMGPAPFIPISTNLVLTMVSASMVGVSTGACVIPIFNIVLHKAYALGFSKDIVTYSLVSGLLNSSYSLGLFFGPTFGGYFIDTFGVKWVITGFAFMMLGCSLLVLTCIALHGSFRISSKSEPAPTTIQQTD